MTLLFNNETAAVDSLIWPAAKTGDVDSTHRGGPLMITMEGDFGTDAEILAHVQSAELDEFVLLTATNFLAPDSNEMQMGKGCKVKFSIIADTLDFDISLDVLEL